MILPRKAALLAVALLVAGCAHAPDSSSLTPQQRLQADVVRLSSRAEALLRTQDERVWKSWTQGGPMDLGGTYAGNEDLFTPQSIAEIAKLRSSATDPREQRALDHLHAYFVGEYLAHGTAEVNEAITQLEASISFESQDEPYRLRALERLLANEKSAVKRQTLYTDATEAIDRLDRRIARREEEVDKLLGGLGSTSAQYGAELREVDLDHAAQLADALLSRTQAPYLEVMDRLAHAELQAPFSSIQPADLPRLFRPEVVDRAFPKEAVMPRVRETLLGLGIDLSTVGGVTIDEAERSGKSPRGLTVALSPSDVRVSILPAAGLRAQMAALHEIGHALHDRFTQEQRFELARLGDVATSEGFAQLFEDLAEDPVWLSQEAGLRGGQLDRYLSASSARKLFLLRREAARLLFGIAHHRDPSADPAALYAPLLQRMLGMPVNAQDTARALYDEEELYASADALRAWIFSAQLQGILKARFGPAWWKSAAAGSYLRELWAHGTALTPEELMVKAGEPGLLPDTLLLRLASALRVQLPLATATTAAPSAANTSPPASR